MAHKLGQTSAELTKVREIALILTLLLCTLAFTFSPTLGNSVVIKETDKAIEVKMEKVEITQQVQKTEVQQAAAVKVSVITAADDADTDALSSDKLAIENVDDVGTNAPPPPPPPPPPNEDEEVIDFVAIAEKPVLEGGMASVYKFLKYPPIAQKTNISGRASIRFICGADGVPKNFEILQEDPEGMGFGQAAMNAIMQVRFKPGYQRDKPVSVRMVLPVNFKIKK